MTAAKEIPYEYHVDGCQKLYVAGPMRGYYEFNFPAFDRATWFLQVQGHEVFNPAERDRNKGFDPTGMMGTQQELDTLDFSLREALAADLQWICLNAEGIYMLPGWSRSTGALAEWRTGIALGLKFYGAPA